MPRRMTSADAAFWYGEQSTTPMQVGTIAVFKAPKGGLDHEALVTHIGQRLAFVPRFRQRVREIPLGIARPVWVDDESFDITFHVRRSALPRPGSMEQLNELAARLLSRPLDKSRPLWEMYLVEGLADGDVALIAKTHEALVDGIAAVDLVSVLLDPTPEPAAVRPHAWHPNREPSDIELVTAAMTETLTRPAAAVEAVRDAIEDISSSASAIARRVTDVAASLVAAARPAEHSALQVPVGQHRRFATATFALDQVRRVHQEFDATVNDVLLAVVAGGLRSWLRSRDVEPSESLRALVPISTQTEEQVRRRDSSVAAFIVDLPVGEPDPVRRLQLVAAQLVQVRQSDRLAGADTLIGMAGFGPATLHALGARMAADWASRLFSLEITNVPGPQQPMYLSGARMVASYACIPLTRQQAVTIAFTSYDGHVFVGVNADRDAVSDIDVLVDSLGSALAELVAVGKPRGLRGLRAVR